MLVSIVSSQWIFAAKQRNFRRDELSNNVFDVDEGVGNRRGRARDTILSAITIITKMRKIQATLDSGIKEFVNSYLHQEPINLIELIRLLLKLQAELKDLKDASVSLTPTGKNSNIRHHKY